MTVNSPDRIIADHVCPACMAVIIEGSIKYSAVSKEVREPIHFKGCAKCGCLFAPEAAALASELYANRSSTNFSPKKFNILRKIKKEKFRHDYNFILKNEHICRVIDIGCGNGDVANALVNEVVSVIAVDVPTNRPLGLNESIVYMSSYDFSNHLLGSGRNLFILRHVLEHFENPEAELNMLKRIANVGDLILIETPNANSLFRILMGSSWPGYFPPFHVTVPTLQTLKVLAERANLEILSTKMKEPPIIGTWLTQKFKMFNNLSRLIGLSLYPLQWILSKISNRSEAIEILLCKRS